MTDRMDDHINEAFVRSVLTALARGPIGETILAVAKGERKVVIWQHATGQGWTIETEAVDG